MKFDRSPGAGGTVISRLLRLFFYHFYHRFAWTYDFVAAVVSQGRWNQWIRATLPFLVGPNALELGFGPGHLQEYMLKETPLSVMGLDESAEMVALAKRRLAKSGPQRPNLARGLAQALPFRTEAFGTIVSTFPSEYAFDQRTLGEVRRVLQPEGQLVLVPAAWIVGEGLVDRAASWLFRLTHQAPASAKDALTEHLQPSLQEAGFRFESHLIRMRSSSVLLIVARKEAA